MGPGDACLLACGVHSPRAEEKGVHGSYSSMHLTCFRTH